MLFTQTKRLSQKLFYPVLVLEFFSFDLQHTKCIPTHFQINQELLKRKEIPGLIQLSRCIYVRVLIRPRNLYRTEYIVCSTYLIQNEYLRLINLISVLNKLSHGLKRGPQNALNILRDSTHNTTHMIFIHKAFRQCFQTFFLKKARL